MIHRCEKHGLAWQSEDPDTKCADCAREGRFDSWQPANMAKLAAELEAENAQLKADNKVLHAAWRKAVSA